MRLKKIIVNGFKSFADKTEFDFDAQVTAIVGPNGCGKSNVVDAVKWVLGEQSVKSLRSGNMADVIFGGSSSRKPLGSADVTLVMSNDDGQQQGRLSVETQEVAVTRRIFRSGESEYRINNKLCRLKDIRELFMDTGVGTKAYSIIEQGQIDRILSASKQDRRILFEEAAGISKYKAHKKEAMRKLERTEQNLLRLADILGEVTKRLRSVKLAAGKARNYLAYTERLKELQVNYSLVEYGKNQTLLEEKGRVLGEVEEQFARIASEVGRNDALVSRLGSEIIDTEHRLNEAGNALVSVQSKIEQQLQQIDFLRSRMEELGRRGDAERERIDQLDRQQNSFEIELEQNQAELAACEAMLAEKSDQVRRFEATIQEINGQCASLEAELDDEKSGIIDIVRRTAQLHNEIQSIGAYRSNLSNQKERLAGRAQTARTELENLLTQRAQHQARLADIEKVLLELQESLDAKKTQAEQAESAIEADRKRLANNKEARSALTGELKVLADMERRYEGLTAGVKSILQGQTGDSGLDYVQGILADIVEADIDHASAVEAALEGRTDSVVVSNIGALMADRGTIDRLQGRVEFLDVNAAEPFTDDADLSGFEQIKGRAVQFVRFEPQYGPLVWSLLGKTLVVESLEAAAQLSNRLGGRYRFVTREGEFIGSDGVLRLGPLGKTTGLISRKSRMRQLQEAIDHIASEIADTEGRIERSLQARDHLARVCKDLRTAVYEANTEKMQTGSKLAAIEDNVRRLKQEEPLIAGEIDQLAAQIAESVQREYDSKQKLEELEAVNSERQSRIEELEAQLDERRQQQQTHAADLTDLRIALGRAREQSKALNQIIAGLQNQIQNNARTGQSARREIAGCTEQLAAAQSDILRCEAAVSELFVAKEGRQDENRLLRERIEQLLAEQHQAEQEIRARRQEKDEIDHRIGDLRVELGQLQVKQQDLVERVREELQIDLAEAYKTHTEQSTDWEQAKQEIVDLRQKIERLGNVNLDAIEEQDALEERNSFLSAQLEDLNTSKGQLQQLINRLNKQSRDKFQQTFDEIRANFQEIFRKLFGGGKADILLEEAEDILDAGIEIIAKPPGKETRSISLLSGGEKSMTALALMFSVFKSKPSPFCFLDEVDAALDEANNERFNQILREFQTGSQFIVITHSKRTMSICDVLFGVTMQVRGVSKKISVRFDEYSPEEEPAAA